MTGMSQITYSFGFQGFHSGFVHGFGGITRGAVSVRGVHGGLFSTCTHDQVCGVGEGSACVET